MINISQKALKGLLVIAILIAIACTFIAFNSGDIDKLWKAVWANFQYPFMLILIIGFAGYWKLTHPKEFTWGEFTAFIVVLPIICFPVTAAFYLYSTDLYDTEIWNGHVKKAVYEEEWTEEVQYTETTCDSEGKNCTIVTKTREDYHPPEWFIITNNNERVSISSLTFREYTQHFGNKKLEDLYRSSQVSYGDGNMYYSLWEGNNKNIVPTAVSHNYVNYLRASDSIRKLQGTTDAYLSLLQDYPEIHKGTFGAIEFNRVLTAGLKLPQQWIDTVDSNLSKSLTTLGKKKQVNIIVYVVKSNIGFFHALKEHWVDGKKNDVIVVIGSQDSKTIDWVQVQAWTKVELFKIQLADKVRELKTFEGNAENIVNVITTQVSLDAKDGGFERLPMEELEYLLLEIELPWWATILVILGNLIICTPIIIYLLTNNIRRKEA